MSPRGSWVPTQFRRFEQSFPTSVGTSIVVTDKGKAYLKAVGNPEGPHVLAAEWLGTQLADWLGLTTFDYSVLVLESIDEIPLPSGTFASPGPAFVSRLQAGSSWGGDQTAIDEIVNLGDLAGYVILDTWIRNCDRYAPHLKRKKFDNVFLSTEALGAGQARLIAMDYTHSFTCGRPFTPRIASIECVKDEEIYGLFPQFVKNISRPQVVAIMTKLAAMNNEASAALVQSIPAAWQVDEGTRSALAEFIVQRAAFLSDNMVKIMEPACWPPSQRDLFTE